jgi:acetolactate synthase-1/2/3 large subunit
MNVAEFLVSIVEGLGVDVAFTLTGGMAMHINRAVGESSLTAVYCNHEQAAAASADGYAKAKYYQTPGLVVVTSGPGVTNIVTSVASAYHDSVPLIILAGQIKTGDINRSGVRSRGAQETPHLALMAPITKCAFRYTPDEVSDDLLALNLSQALSGRKGPVFVEIPLDVQSGPVVDGEQRVKKIVQAIGDLRRVDANDSENARSIMQALRDARRPVIVFGNALRIAGISRDRIARFVERLEIPALFTWASFDLMEHAHPLNFGCAGGLAPTHSNTIIQDADVAVFLGTRLDLLTTAFNPDLYARNAHRIVVEIDPNEIAKNANLSNTTFLRDDISSLFPKLEALETDVGKVEWLASCVALRSADRLSEDDAFKKDDLSVYNISRLIAETEGLQYVVPTASGFATEGLARFFRPGRNVTFAWAGHSLGSMGLGLPHAIGAAAATRGPVLCVEGDGGIMLNIQELFTLAANPRLRVDILIMNNHGYKSISQSQRRTFGREYGASAESGLVEVPFRAVAEAAGFDYVRCGSLNELKVALTGNPGPGRRRIIDADVQDRDGYRGPGVMTKFDENGRPYSTRIDDVSWAR